MDLGIGESGRLQHIKEMIENQKELYVSDKKYLDQLVGTYLYEKKSDMESPNQKKLSSIFEISQKKKKLQSKFFSQIPGILTVFFSSDNTSFINLGKFLARAGLAFVFSFAGFSKLSGSVPIEEMIVNLTGVSSGFASGAVMTIGSIEIVAGVFLLLGFFTRLAGFASSLVLIGGGLLFRLDFTADMQIWKDVGLLGMCILIFLSGPGKWSLDYLVFRRLKRSKFKMEIERLKPSSK